MEGQKICPSKSGATCETVKEDELGQANLAPRLGGGTAGDSRWTVCSAAKIIQAMWLRIVIQNWERILDGVIHFLTTISKMMASTITPELQPKTSGHVQACIDGIASRGRDEPEISSRRHKWSSSSFSRNLQMLSGGRDLTGESNKRSCVGSDEMSLRKLRQMSEEFESESEIEETEELEVSRTPQPEWLNVTTDIAQILDEMMYEFCETTEFESESKIEATDKLEVLKNNNSGSSSEGGAANITAQRGTPLPNAAVQHDPVITCPRQKKPPK
jgi:hypothetical protein